MFKLSRHFTLVLLFFACSVCHSQTQMKDSLQIILRNNKVHDTTKLFAFAMTLEQYNIGDPNFIYANNLMGSLAYKNLRKNNNTVLHKKYTMYLGAYYNNLGNEYGSKRDLPKALGSLDKSISLFKSVQAYDEMNYALIGKSILLSKVNEYEKAISCLFTVLKFAEKDKINNVDLISYVQSSLATIYSDHGLHEKSIAYNKQSIEYYKQKKSLTIDDENRLASAYVNCGSSYFELGNYAAAMSNFDEALRLFKKAKHETHTSIVLSKMGRVKMRERKFDESERLLKEALLGEIAPVAIANANVKLGELYFEKKDFGKADFYLTKGFELSKEIMNLELQTQASELLFKTSQANKNFEKALEMHVFHDKLIDSSKSEKSKNILAQQQLKYDFEKKELNYTLATQRKNAVKNNWLIALSGALLLILLGGFFYYRNSRQKQEIAILEKNQIRQKLLVSQMNPHFIFNSIENIRSLIFDNQNHAAVNYLGKFSKLTRQILENSNENYISLAEEIEMTENYLSIQQLLYNNKFNFAIDVEEQIDTESVFLPPMLTQPFIENAIKHGLGNTTQNGQIDIRFYLTESKLFFEVSDNGKGFDASQKTNDHKSLAMAITKERLVTYTKNQDFVVQTSNITDGNEKVTGAKVIFEIPYIYEN